MRETIIASGNFKHTSKIVDGIIIGMIYLNFFMKKILIFATIASVALVIAYYLVIQKDDYSDDLSISPFD
jgi:hypothetical protein